jgi:hypothetical protein
MRLDRATSVMPLGIAVGLLMIGLNFITNVWVAAPFLVLLGALCGFLVVPMNALLQHRGHNLMGAGRSIAVQNFNEQACILALGALYSRHGQAGAVGLHRHRRAGAQRGRRDVADQALAPAQLHPGLTNVGFNWAVTVGDVVRVVLLFYLMPPGRCCWPGRCWVKSPRRRHCCGWYWRWRAW